MNAGLVSLVPVAELIADLTDRRGIHLAADIARRGLAALPRRQDDAVAALRQLLLDTSVVLPDGRPNDGRAHELVVVCDILAAATPPLPPPTEEQRLVLSAPEGTATISDYERLEGLVLDVLRRSVTSIHIGGAFWNGDGFTLLNDVLIPALELRHTNTTLYVNPPDKPAHRATLDTQIEALRAAGPVNVLWYTGARPTMLHAKFVIGDRSRGYLGTANLTSWGMQGGHVEAGVALSANQCERFVTFLDELHEAGLFTSRAPA